MRFERIFPGQSVVSVFKIHGNGTSVLARTLAKRIAEHEVPSEIFLNHSLSTSACDLNHFKAGLWDFFFSFLCRNKCLSLAKEFIQC